MNVVVKVSMNIDFQENEVNMPLLYGTLQFYSNTSNKHGRNVMTYCRRSVLQVLQTQNTKVLHYYTVYMLVLG